MLKTDRPEVSWRAVYGTRKGKGNGTKLSIEEIKDAIADAAAGTGAAGMCNK